jgi:hypothetical protein
MRRENKHTWDARVFKTDCRTCLRRVKEKWMERDISKNKKGRKMESF